MSFLTNLNDLLIKKFFSTKPHGTCLNVHHRYSKLGILDIILHRPLVNQAHLLKNHLDQTIYYDDRLKAKSASNARHGQKV